MGDAQKLMPAYLLVGEDRLKAEKTLEKLESYVDESMADFNLDIVDAMESIDKDELLLSLNTLPFMTDLRLVVIKNAESLNKDVSEMLVEYLSDPLDTTTVALVATKLAKNTRLYKAIDKLGKKAVIPCEPKKRWELPEHVRSMAIAHGKTIQPRAAEVLVSLVGESTIMLDTELAKLSVIVGDRDAITLEDVEENVARIAEVKPWDFMDEVCERRPDRAMALFHLMPSQNLIGLYTLMLSRIRELLTAKALDRRGVPQTLAAELGMRDWQVKHHLRWSRNYTREELLKALTLAADCEYQLKSSANKELVFVTWILSFCTAK